MTFRTMRFADIMESYEPKDSEIKGKEEYPYMNAYVDEGDDAFVDVSATSAALPSSASPYDCLQTHKSSGYYVIYCIQA